ncbi:unnamed protein product [Arabidopsis lyrata]|nr:unnamed protein product [Arabidopsis lyrata]
MVSSYGPDEGLLELRQTLLNKLREENKLTQSQVMVTAGVCEPFASLDYVCQVIYSSHLQHN